MRKWPYREYATTDELSELSVIDAECAMLDARRQELTGRRNYLVNRLVKRARLRILFPTKHPRISVSHESEANHVNTMNFEGAL